MSFTMEKETKKAPFAVIETGGKQYMVSQGDVLDVELLGGETTEGDTVTFENVLMTDDGSKSVVGEPFVKGAKVKASFVKETKAKKLSIVRYEAKSNRFRKVGHRQKYATVKIESIA